MGYRVLGTRLVDAEQRGTTKSCERCGRLTEGARPDSVHCVDCSDLIKLERYYQERGVTLYDFTEEELDEMMTDRYRRRRIIVAVVRRVQARMLAAGTLTLEELDEMERERKEAKRKIA